PPAVARSAQKLTTRERSVAVMHCVACAGRATISAAFAAAAARLGWPVTKVTTIAVFPGARSNSYDHVGPSFPFTELIVFNGAATVPGPWRTCPRRGSLVVVPLKFWKVVTQVSATVTFASPSEVVTMRVLLSEPRLQLVDTTTCSVPLPTFVTMLS